MKRANVLPLISSLLLLGLGTTGCEPDADPPEPAPQAPELDESSLPFSESWDSAGVRIVENARPADTAFLDWRIGPEPSVTIGVAVGDEAQMLFRVSDAVRLSDGRVVVAETSSSELKVFDPTGTRVGTWGGRGEGPGEFPEYMLQRIEPWPADSIVAWYGPGWRVSAFDSEGNFDRTFLGPSGNQATWRAGRPRLAAMDGSILTTLDGDERVGHRPRRDS